MAAQSIYVKIVRLALRPASNVSKRRINELNEHISELHRFLSCVVCCQLLSDPYKPKAKCNHYVCRLCIFEKKHLTPSCPECSKCSDYRTYDENRAMALQVSCYKAVCVHLLQSLLFAQLAGLRPQFKDDTTTNASHIKLPHKTTQDCIKAGANYDDFRDTFLLQPDLPELNNLPSSLPAVSPPTTAATTPEFPYEQQLPDELSIRDIEMEVANTAENEPFIRPLPIVPDSSRIFAHNVGSPLKRLPALTRKSEQAVSASAGNIFSSFQHMGLAAAVPMSGIVNTELSAGTSKFTYLLPSTDSTVVVQTDGVTLPAIGQVVQMTESTQATALTLVQAPTEIPALPDEPTNTLSRQPAVSEDNKTQGKDTISKAITKGSDTSSHMSLRKKPVKEVTSQLKSPVKTISKDKKPASSSLKKKNLKPLSCRCGTTTAPNNMTCRGSRCPCYNAGRACIDCRCCGCRNPHRPGDDDSGSDSQEELVPEPISTSELRTDKQVKGAAENTISTPMETDTPQQLSGVTFVALSNLQQSEHPLVLMQNECGDFQGFNIFVNGNVPLDPASLVGFQRVLLQNKDPSAKVPQYAYVWAPPDPVQTIAPVLDGITHFSPIVSEEEFIQEAQANPVVFGDKSGASNAAAGDSITSFELISDSEL